MTGDKNEFIKYIHISDAHIQMAAKEGFLKLWQK